MDQHLIQWLTLQGGHQQKIYPSDAMPFQKPQTVESQVKDRPDPNSTHYLTVGLLWMDPNDEYKLCLLIVFHDRTFAKPSTSQSAAAQLQNREWYYYAFNSHSQIIIPLLWPAPVERAGFLFCNSLCVNLSRTSTNSNSELLWAERHAHLRKRGMISLSMGYFTRQLWRTFSQRG